MAEGHIECTLCVFVCVCVCVCVVQIRVRPITSFCMLGFKNHLAQMITKTRRCVARKNLVARKKSRSQLALKGFDILKSCPTYNFIMHGGN